MTRLLSQGLGLYSGRAAQREERGLFPGCKTEAQVGSCAEGRDRGTPRCTSVPPLQGPHPHTKQVAR